jgi:N utilization substance protein A
MSEIIEALNLLAKEKNLDKEEIMQGIEKAIASACEKDYGKNTQYSVNMDRETGEIRVYTHKTVVEQIMDPRTDITLEEAQQINPYFDIDDEVPVEITTMDFGRIATQKAKGIILQQIKEGERRSVFNKYKSMEKHIVTGVVQRYVGKNISVALDDHTETLLSEKEIIPRERYKMGDRIKLYILEVRETNKGGFRIITSRTHPDFVKLLFEREVTEIADGTVEIKSITREAGSRTKIAVWSKNPNVDAVGSCVGVNGERVKHIVDELNGEKIDIIKWDEDPAIFIENAIRPSEVISVDVYPEEKEAFVVVPDDKLSLAIGLKGQNARLAAFLTGYKIDIKSDRQLEEAGYDDEEEYDDELIDDTEDAVEETEEAVEETAEESSEAEETEDTSDLGDTAE